MIFVEASLAKCVESTVTVEPSKITLKRSIWREFHFPATFARLCWNQEARWRCTNEDTIKVVFLDVIYKMLTCQAPTFWKFYSCMIFFISLWFFYFSNALSNHCTVVWVTRPERPNGVKDEVKQARRTATLKYIYINIFNFFFKFVYFCKYT